MNLGCVGVWEVKVPKILYGLPYVFSRQRGIRLESKGCFEESAKPEGFHFRLAPETQLPAAYPEVLFTFTFSEHSLFSRATRFSVPIYSGTRNTCNCYCHYRGIVWAGKAIRLDAQLVSAHQNRSVAYAALWQYQRAIQDSDSAPNLPMPMRLEHKATCFLVRTRGPERY